MSSFPLELVLPDGIAHYVAGSAEAGHPCYQMDGVDLEIAVVIPDDLAAAGWFWWGSYLSWRDGEYMPGISISTGTYPPPNGGRYDRPTCFEQASIIERLRAEYAAKARPKQLEMELI